MSISFSPNGPAFPEQLVDALLAGEVLFLCGAGISAPQLPGFSQLVERCFEYLNIKMTPSEDTSFKAERFEEALGSLSRRIVDPSKMTRAVVHLLQPSADIDLSHHRTVLRLSRDLENRPSIVTTNFDTLLEQALLERESVESVRVFSSAGQDLPPPGSVGFGGIIHLHGRIADKRIGLEETPLVVTSADYGDAYMRSSWASRFLFDLCRCKTIVLIGYSAGDAPVRYFLNVLEADRQRFPDLRLVYAFDAIDARSEADARWEALAVVPVTYVYELDSANGKGQHTALWRDLDRLAELVERPRITRRVWAQRIFAKPFADTDSVERTNVLWLFKGKRDLWSIAIKEIEDAAWFDFFAENELWSNDDANWIVAKWTSQDFQSIDRLNRAIVWMKRLGRSFATVLARELRNEKDLPLPWLRAWRLLTTHLSEPSREWDERSYVIQQTLKSALVLNSDLLRAVDLLTPKLEIEASTGRLLGKPVPSSVESLHDLMWPRLRVRDLSVAPELVRALLAVGQPIEIMSVATSRLRTAIGVSLDAGAIDGEYDSNDFAVPSVEPHRQNEHHDGPIFLVELLARLLPFVAVADTHLARGFANSWRAMPGILGVRLWLHALRSSLVFSADEAMSGLQSLPDHIFWTVRRELVLVLKDRAAGAKAKLVLAIERRILTKGKTYFSTYSIEPGQADWRSHASDTAVWLRLNMLGSSGKLSTAGAAELSAIKTRREYLRRDVEDSDFFGSYSTDVSVVVGDAQPIIDASAEDRLEVAHNIINSPYFDKQRGWSVYCRTDPHGAFDTLSQAPLASANSPLWNDLIGSLSFAESHGTHNELVRNIFNALSSSSEEFFALIAQRLATLYWNVSLQGGSITENLWKRLFDAAVKRELESLDLDQDFYGVAINSSGGRLVEAILLDMQRRYKSSEEIEVKTFELVNYAASATGRQGAFARAILVQSIDFVVAVDAKRTVELLKNSLNQESTEAAALRSILVTKARTSIDVTRTFSESILRGVTDFNGKSGEACVAASKIIEPVLSVVRGEKDAVSWGIGVADVAKVLRESSPVVREGVADFLKRWINQIGSDPALAWRSSIHPLLSQIWPLERTLKEVGQTRHFASLAIKSKEAFPEALEWLLPHLSPLNRGSIDNVESSEVPEKFPQETLKLLWRLFGGSRRADVNGMPAILDRMALVLPAIELDRRFQWLYQNSSDHID